MHLKIEFKPISNDVRDITREVIRDEVPAMIREELKPLHHELREIHRHLDTLDEQYKNLKGVTKEIDELRAQVRKRPLMTAGVMDCARDADRVAWCPYARG